MKIAVVGDFHGKFPVGLQNKIKKENVDLILSVGDFCGNEKLAEMIFKYFYYKDKKKIPEKIKKEKEILEKKSLNSGIDVLKKLKKLKISFFGVHGNWDPVFWEKDIGWRKKEIGLKKFHKYFKKNFQMIDFKLKNFQNIVLIGGTSSSYPGTYTKAKLKRIEKEDGKQEVKKYINQVKKHTKKRKQKYEKLFEATKKKNKLVIFLTHNCPNRTKLDKIKKGPQKGKHYGSILEKEIIKKFKPDLVLCGHIHEGKGKCKIGKTILINPGPAFEGKAVIIEIDEKNKIKTKFFS